MKYVLYYLLLFPLFLAAQSDKSDTLKFKAGIAVTGFQQAGNVDTWIFRAKSDMSFKPSEKWIFKTINSYVYQAFGKQKADEDFLSLNFIYFNPDRKIYPLLLGFVSTNFRREIDTRYLLGAGVTYQIVNTKNQSLKLSVSSEYEQTDFDKATFNRPEYNGQKEIDTFRGTIWVNGEYNLFDKKVIVSHELYYQPSLEQSNNFRWQADLGLELPIWKFLNFKINYLHTFESIVIEGQKQEDSMMSFGFNLKNY